MLSGFAGKEISEEEGGNRLTPSSTVCDDGKSLYRVNIQCILWKLLPSAVTVSQQQLFGMLAWRVSDFMCC